jgi:DNA-binding transcriptional LysR family regulator
LFNEVGITPKITLKERKQTLLQGLVAAGLGVSILLNLKWTDQSKISQIPVNSPKCQRTIGIAWIEGRYLSPATEKFKQFVLDHSYELE